MEDQVNKNDALITEELREESATIPLKMDPSIYPVIPLTEILKEDRIYFSETIKKNLDRFTIQTKAAFHNASTTVTETVLKSIQRMKKKETASVLSAEVNEENTTSTIERPDEPIENPIPQVTSESTDTDKIDASVLQETDLECARSMEYEQDPGVESTKETDVLYVENTELPIQDKNPDAEEDAFKNKEPESFTIATDRSQWLNVLAEEAGLCRTDKRRSVVEHVLDLFKETEECEVLAKEIAKVSSVSNTTVRSVLEELVNKDLLSRVSGNVYSLSSSVLAHGKSESVQEMVHETDREKIDAEREVCMEDGESAPVLQETVKKQANPGYSKAVLIREVNDGDLLPKYVEEYSGEPARTSWKARLLDPAGNMMEQAKSAVHSSLARPLFLVIVKYGCAAFFLLNSLFVLLNKAPFSFARMTFTDASSIWIRILFFGILTEFFVDRIELFLGGGKDMKRFLDIESEGAIVLAVLYSISGLCLRFSWVASLVILIVALCGYRILHTYSLELTLRTDRNKTMWISLIGTCIGVVLVVLWFNLAGADIVRIINSFVQF